MAEIEIIKEENKDKKEEVIELYTEKIPVQSFNDIIKQENPVRLSDISRNLGNVFVKSVNGITVESGSDILLKHGGDIKFTSVTAPTACTGALAGAAGNVDDGDHYYKVTYVNATGETELGTASNLVTVADKTADGQVSLTAIPVSSSGSVTSRKIYRTKAGGSTYFLLTTITDNTTTTYTDNIADASLTGVSVNYKNNSTAGKLKYDGVVGIYITSGGTGSSDTEFSNVGVGKRVFDAVTSGHSNVVVGSGGLMALTTGIYNTTFGIHSGKEITTGGGNTLIGARIHGVTIGSNNTCLGNLAGHRITSGEENTLVGYQAGANAGAVYGIETGNNNVIIGTKAGLYLAVDSTANVFLGYKAGYYETGSSKLFIDNAPRTNEADGRVKALVYGVFAATTAAQIVNINANLNVSEVIKIDGVQVVSNRVVDARCDDAINSGDATTDGVIDALRDAMITHGLIAAV